MRHFIIASFCNPPIGWIRLIGSDYDCHVVFVIVRANHMQWSAQSGQPKMRTLG